MTMIKHAFFLSLMLSLPFSYSHAAYVKGGEPIVFDNNARIDAAFSLSSPNKIFIKGEKIVSVYGTDGVYSAEKSSDGGALIILNSELTQKFTLYLVTDKNTSLSVVVHPKNIDGKTLNLVSTNAPEPIAKETGETEKQEPDQYAQQFIDIARDLLNGTLPDNVKEYPKQKPVEYRPHVPVTLTIDRQFVAPGYRIVRYIVTNPSYLPLDLSEKDFYRAGVKAIMLSERKIYANGHCWLYVFFEYKDGGVNG